MTSRKLDNLERSFVDCLREIERSYLSLSKQLRIRVEKWVEKLLSTGDNDAWRKHRNAYAKLLLNMITKRNITDPFHILPPDGPLPSFPFHLTSQLNQSIGPHESMFWHDIYDRMVITKENPKLENNNNSRSSIKTLSTLPQSREIDNLNLLIKEQEKRIQLLEQQIHDERVQHELQIQRINYTHRIDLTTALRRDKRAFIDQSMSNMFDTSQDINLSHASPQKGGTSSLPNFLHPSTSTTTQRLDKVIPPSIGSSTQQRQNDSQPKSLNSHSNYSLSDSTSRRLPPSHSAVSRSDASTTLNSVDPPIDILPTPSKAYTFMQQQQRESVTGDNNLSVEDDDFMAYIERFQSEIGLINQSLGEVLQTAPVTSSLSTFDMSTSIIDNNKADERLTTDDFYQ